jgi:hypothetical protein
MGGVRKFPFYGAKAIRQRLSLVTRPPFAADDITAKFQQPIHATAFSRIKIAVCQLPEASPTSMPKDRSSAPENRGQDATTVALLRCQWPYPARKVYK